MCVAATVDSLEIIRSEYEEMPQLLLTVAQASRLWNLEAFVAEALLEALVASGFLMRTPDRRYGRVRSR